MLALAEAIRDFCRENNYEVLENYETHTMFGEPVTTLAIVVKPDINLFEVLAQLTSYLEAKLEAKLIEDSVLEELEGANVNYTDADSVDSDALIYFPSIKGYQPLQPEE